MQDGRNRGVAIGMSSKSSIKTRHARESTSKHGDEGRLVAEERENEVAEVTGDLQQRWERKEKEKTDSSRVFCVKIMYRGWARTIGFAGHAAGGKVEDKSRSERDAKIRLMKHSIADPATCLRTRP